MTITRSVFVEMVAALHTEVDIILDTTGLTLTIPTRSEPAIEELARLNGIRAHPVGRTPINSIIRLYGFAGALEPASEERRPRLGKPAEAAAMVRAMAEDAKRRS